LPAFDNIIDNGAGSINRGSAGCVHCGGWMKLSYRSALLPIMAVLFAFGLQSAHLPAAWLFGPLVASALFAVRDWQAVELPRPVYIGAQAVIGTALGAGFSPATLLTLPKHFSIFAFAVIFILLTSLFNGWLLTRRTRLNVATAFLGTMPGGAGEMAAMSDSLRADSRLVVIMQYTRLLLILASLALVTPFLSHHSSSIRVPEAPALLLATFAWWKIGTLCLLAFIGWLTGLRTRIPAGTFLVPTVLYFLLEIGGVQPGRWPWLVFATAYLVMGLQIGGRFRPSTLAAIKDILLPVCGTTLVLLAGSFILAWILSREMGLDPVSAYLAATPGGLDSVAAVAAELKGDTAVILTVHLVRLLCVLIVGPWLVRACSRWLGKRANSEDPS
jgi:membrane AbrB-like protein